MYLFEVRKPGAAPRQLTRCGPSSSSFVRVLYCAKSFFRPACWRSPKRQMSLGRLRSVAQPRGRRDLAGCGLNKSSCFSAAFMRRCGLGLYYQKTILAAINRNHVCHHLPRYGQGRAIRVASLLLFVVGHRQGRAVSCCHLCRLDENRQQMRVALLRKRCTLGGSPTQRLRSIGS